MTAQLDLFAETEAADQVDQDAELAEADAAYRALIGDPPTCPACGITEHNDWLIGNNHGIRPWHMERQDDGTWRHDGPYDVPEWCLALSLTANHVAGGHDLSQRQTTMLAGLRPEVRERFDREVADTCTVVTRRSGLVIGDLFNRNDIETRPCKHCGDPVVDVDGGPVHFEVSENGARTAWPYCWVTVRGLRKRSTQVAA